LEDILIIVIVAIIFAILAVLSAFVLMKLNRNKRVYIETHQENVIVLEKIAKRIGEEKTELNQLGIQFFVKLRLRDGKIQDFKVRYSSFCDIRTGETAVAVVKKERLIYYKSEHRLSMEAGKGIYERMPVYHEIKKGNSVDFYCEIPSKDLVIFSYEAIQLDYEEIAAVFRIMSKNLEEFFYLDKEEDSSLEIVSAEKGTDIILYENGEVYEMFSLDDSLTEEIILKWMEGNLRVSDHPFELI